MKIARERDCERGGVASEARRWRIFAEICNRGATKPAAPPRRKTDRDIFKTRSKGMVSGLLCGGWRGERPREPVTARKCSCRLAGSLAPAKAAHCQAIRNLPPRRGRRFPFRNDEDYAILGRMGLTVITIIIATAEDCGEAAE